MLVKLARNWFDPSGSLRETRFNPQEIPDEWKDVLPKSAEVLDDEPVKKPAKADDSAKK